MSRGRGRVCGDELVKSALEGTSMCSRACGARRVYSCIFYHYVIGIQLSVLYSLSVRCY